ncbi:MAG: hypothetical protein LBS71_02195 [Puniceicoccales bacterium]|jgi:hypothetical protein|nr:hypothetical protein [Puniceicoccales bacterium]
MRILTSFTGMICYIIGFVPAEEIHFESKMTYIIIMAMVIFLPALLEGKKMWRVDIKIEEMALKDF